MYLFTLLILSSSSEEQLLQTKYTRTEKKATQSSRELHADSFVLWCLIFILCRCQHDLTCSDTECQGSLLSTHSQKTVYCYVNALSVKYVNMCDLVQRNSNTGCVYGIWQSPNRNNMFLSRNDMTCCLFTCVPACVCFKPQNINKTVVFSLAL